MAGEESDARTLLISFKAALATNTQVDDLLGKLAIINPDLRNQPAIIGAAVKGQQDVIELLLRQGLAQIDDKMKETDKTALHIAVQRGVRKMLDLLLRLNADVDVIDREGNTPLHAAVIFEQLDILVELARHGPSTVIANNLGKYPIQVAIDSGIGKEDPACQLALEFVGNLLFSSGSDDENREAVLSVFSEPYYSRPKFEIFWEALRLQVRSMNILTQAAHSDDLVEKALSYLRNSS